MLEYFLKGRLVKYYNLMVVASRPYTRIQVIAVDADSVNLAYIRKSLEKNALWGSTPVRLIHNAVRFVNPKRPTSFSCTAHLKAFINISIVHIFNMQ